jgi:hypothetical protein
MRAVPRQPFEACRYEHVKTNGYGKFVLDGRHSYSSSPMYAEREILVRISASCIEPLNDAGEVISSHARAFGSDRTDTADWLTIVDQLIAKPGAWRNSPMRSQMSYEVRDYMDEQDKSGLRQALRLVKDLSRQYGLDVAITSMQEALVRRRTGGITINAAIIAGRIAHYGLDTPSEPGPDLTRYDALLATAGGTEHGPQ